MADQTDITGASPIAADEITEAEGGGGCVDDSRPRYKKKKATKNKKDKDIEADLPAHVREALAAFKAGVQPGCIVSVSGGKDSTATLLLAIERGEPNILPVFCDTGHEHPLTYDYVRYLDTTLRERGMLRSPIVVLQADFRGRFEKRRRTVETKWREEGVPEEIVQRALAALVPTGIPFLDMCLINGMFPAVKTRFCTDELKVEPIERQIIQPLLKAKLSPVQWVGVRADESATRSTYSETEWIDPGVWMYRPILTWTAQDVFEMHRKHNIEPNPLYKLGMSRVGCMPCIMARKDEVAEIARRFPEQIDRVREWEDIVTRAGKHEAATLFATANKHGIGIDAYVKWSMTARGGKYLDFFKSLEPAACSSVYGLCE